MIYPLEYSVYAGCSKKYKDYKDQIEQKLRDLRMMSLFGEVRSVLNLSTGFLDIGRGNKEWRFENYNDYLVHEGFSNYTDRDWKMFEHDLHTSEMLFKPTWQI